MSMRRGLAAVCLLLLFVPAVSGQEVQVTDENGWAVFELSPGKYRVTAPEEADGLTFYAWTVEYPPGLIVQRYASPNVIDIEVKEPSSLVAVYLPRTRAKLEVPIPLEPSGELDTKQVRFRWIGVPNATGYEVHVFDENFDNVFTVSGNVEELVVDNFPGGEFYWTIRAVDGDEYLPSDWSLPMWFSVPHVENWFIGVAALDMKRENMLSVGVMLEGESAPRMTPFVLPAPLPQVAAILSAGEAWGLSEEPAAVFNRILFGAVCAVIGIVFIVSGVLYLRGHRMAFPIAVVLAIVLSLLALPFMFTVRPQTKEGLRFFRWDTGETGSQTNLSPGTPAATAQFGGTGDTITVLAFNYRQMQMSEVSVSIDYVPVGKAPVGKIVGAGEHVVEVPAIDGFGDSFSYWMDYSTDRRREAVPGTYIAIYGDTRLPSEPVIVLTPPKYPHPPRDYTGWMAVFGLVSLAFFGVLAYRRWVRKPF